ncbi:MAG: glycogen synthase GlgA [Candidatus Scalinduaceae bacterium]
MGVKFKVMFVSPEVTPFAKTGGLADVSGSLPTFLKKLGCDVRVALPFYRMVKEQNIPFDTIFKDLEVPAKGVTLKAGINQSSLNDDIPVYFIKYDKFFDRENLYSTSRGDYADNAERFIFFSRSIFELCRKVNFQPDIIHCHEWQTGLIPTYLRTLYNNDKLFSKTAALYSIHNIAYQGIFEKEVFEKTCLPNRLLINKVIEFYGKISFMKVGIIYSDIINTVSQKYSREIQTEEYGCGLQDIIKDRAGVLFGVINGVDYSEWNPETDKFIVANYNANDFSGKVKCKEDLLLQFNLPISLKERPLLGIVSRMAKQKGFDLLSKVIDELMTFDIVFVLLGIGDERYHNLFQEYAHRYPERIGVRIAYDNKLAHKIEAGADIFLMPSRYEPCGLNQIYSLKYGTIPLVRATGGLDDTIKDYYSKDGTGTGFKFDEYKASVFIDKVKEALCVFANKEKWLQLMTNAMSQDFSWERSARAYIELYKKAISTRKGLKKT